jgi:F0F1-type ATP synthase assembly protein I
VATASVKPVIRAVYRIVFYQLMIIVGFMLIVSLLKGIRSGASALAGGLAYWLPSFIFARTVAACASARAAARFMVTFFAGETVKLVFSGALFMGAVYYLPVQIVYAVAGLCFAIVAFWVASIAYLFQPEVKI